MILCENTFLLYAAKHYDNPHCHDEIEFEEDMKRFQYLRKLFQRYKQTGELKERLILNHLIILYNVFGLSATDMLFFKLEGFHDTLKPFISYLNYLQPFVRYDGRIIYADRIEVDANIEKILKGI